MRQKNRTGAIFALTSFLSLTISSSAYPDDLLNSRQNQSDIIPVSGSSGLSQSQVDQKNGINVLSFGAPAEPALAPKAVVQPTAPLPNSGINLGFAQFFKILVEALGKTALPVPALMLNGDEDGVLATALPNKDYLGRSISYKVTKQPANGTVFFVTDPTLPDKIIIKYIPKANFNGNDSFEYQSQTGANGLYSEPAAISLEIKGVNDEPAVTSPNFVFDHALGHIFTGSLGTKTDIDGDNLTYVITKNLNPGIGTIAIDPITQQIAIVPGAECVAGVFNFEYTVSDGKVTKAGIAKVEMKNCELDPENPHEHEFEIGETFNVHNDKAPNFADPRFARFLDGSPRNIIAVADSGKMSDILKTRVIGAEDVLILTGDVLLDVEELNVNTLALYPGAHLKFAVDRNTRLKAANVLVTEGAFLEIGSEANPIADSVIAEVVFKDEPLNLALDPQQYGNGLIAFGKVVMHGRELKDTFIRMSAEPLKGNNQLVLESIPAGWKVGDVLEIPDTRQLTDADRNARDSNAGQGGYDKILSQTEQRRIVSIDGNRVTLSSALTYDHKGARNVDGVLEFLPHVVNLTRNVVLKSENPEGVRGHSLFTHHADVDIRYAGFEDMGRTLNTPLDSTKLNADGSAKSIGANQIGRYSVHFHHLTGKGQANGYQYTLIGNSVVQNLSRHDFKWGIAIHNSHYGLISQNVVFNPRGAGIITEDGSETGNVFDRNYVMSSTGSGDRGDGRTVIGDFGHDGVGFWFRGTNNIVTNNVASDIHGKNDNSHFGFKFFPYQNGSGAVIKVPAFKGADVSKGQFKFIDPNGTPLMEFRNNEVYGAASGITYWWVGMMFETPREAPPSIIQDFKIWHIYGTGFFHYPAANILIDNLIVIGDKNHPAGSGWSGADYGAYNITIRNSRIEGMRTGIVPSTKTSRGLQTYQNLIMKNLTDFSIGTLWTSAANAEFLEPRKIIIDNVKASGIPGKEHKFISMNYEYGTSRTSNLMMLDEVFVRNYKGITGLDFQVYYKQQLADFVPPPSIYSMYGAYPMNVASPEAGLTNQELMQKHGEAVAGAVAPCSDAMAEIGGIVCGGSGKIYENLLSSIPFTFNPEYKVYKNENGKFDIAISWYTIKESDSSVRLTGGISKTFTDSEMRKVHNVTLKDIDPGKEYGYTITSRNASGVFTTENFIMKTALIDPVKDKAGPVVDDIQAGVFAKGAQIRWKTNEATNSFVEYGLDANYGLSASSSFYTGSDMRDITLENLKAGETYHYRVKSIDASGNMTVSADKTFTVPIFTSPRSSQVFDSGDIELTYDYPDSMIGAQFAYLMDMKSGDQKYLVDTDNDGKVLFTGLAEGAHRIRGVLMQGKTEVPKTSFMITIYVKSSNNSSGG